MKQIIFDFNDFLLKVKHCFFAAKYSDKCFLMTLYRLFHSTRLNATSQIQSVIRIHDNCNKIVMEDVIKQI